MNGKKIVMLPMSALTGAPLAFSPGWQVNAGDGQQTISFGNYPSFAEALSIAKIHGTPPGLPQWQTDLFDIPSTVNVQTGEITLHFDKIGYETDGGTISQVSTDPEPTLFGVLRGPTA